MLPPPGNHNQRSVWVAPLCRCAVKMSTLTARRHHAFLNRAAALSFEMTDRRRYRSASAESRILQIFSTWVSGAAERGEILEEHARSVDWLSP